MPLPSPCARVHRGVCGGSHRRRQDGGAEDGTSPRVSPRVRAKLPQPQRVPSSHRYIPACAGGSSESNGALACSTGTSPRVRGKLWLLRKAEMMLRYIPACWVVYTLPTAVSFGTNLPRSFAHQRMAL